MKPIRKPVGATMSPLMVPTLMMMTALMMMKGTEPTSLRRMTFIITGAAGVWF